MVWSALPWDRYDVAITIVALPAVTTCSKWELPMLCVFLCKYVGDWAWNNCSFLTCQRYKVCVLTNGAGETCQGSIVNGQDCWKDFTGMSVLLLKHFGIHFSWFSHKQLRMIYTVILKVDTSIGSSAAPFIVCVWVYQGNHLHTICQHRTIIYHAWLQNCSLYIW